MFTIIIAIALYLLGTAIYQWIIKPHRDAAEYADIHHRSCSPPPMLWIEDGKWCTRKYTDAEKWNLCYDSYKRRFK